MVSMTSTHSTDYSTIMICWVQWVHLLTGTSTAYQTTRLSGHVLGVLVRKLLLRAATLFDDLLVDAVINVVIGLVLMMVLIHVIWLGLWLDVL